MRHSYRLLALTLACAAIGLVCWRPYARAHSAAPVAPYTAHLTVTKNIVRPDGSSTSTVSTVLLARDRQGRTYEKSDHGILVQDPAALQTLTWDQHRPVATIGRWPYWAGRTGCWATGDGQQSRFPAAQDWHDVPPSPQSAKLQTIGLIRDASGRPIKTRFVSENLGHKEIRGISADGLRWTTSPLETASPAMSETTTELWKSKELNLTLLKITSNSRGEIQREELSSLERANPDPALFHPPQDYKVESVTYHQVPCPEQ